MSASDRKPVVPTRVIPAAEPLPAPAAPPPPPPRPPAPPVVADADPLPDWWRTGSGPYGPPPPVPVDVHVTVTIDHGGPPDLPPDPWWKRIRWGYHAAMLLASVPVSGPWASVLDSVRHDAGLAAAWVMAAFVWALIAVWDNVTRIRARHADPDAWLPKWRAALARLLLYAVTLATFFALPLTTLVYWITGVDTP